MKTLVIHPADETTDFLKVIYNNQPDWTIINDPKVSRKFLTQAINKHDRIIMLGHGTQYGLIAMTNYKNFRFVIDSAFVYLLRQKQCVSIWCNANVFFEKYKLTGFYTGMIVSEYEEALMYSVSCLYADIEASNKLFADSVRESIVEPDMLAVMKEKYITVDNNVIHFNKHNLFSK